MTDKLPPNLLALFAPRPPLRYLPHVDHDPATRHTAPITGVAAFLEELHKPDPDYVPTESWLQMRDRKEQEKKKKQEEYLKQATEEYKPDQDPHVRGDPYKTLFVSRLGYEVGEKELEREFGRFGPIERIRIVRDKNTNKSRGYAFIVYEREKDMKAAYKETDGLRLKDGRRISVDVERGRTVKGWKPRRLGGGLGGRGYTKAAITRPSGPAFGDRFDRGPPGGRGGFRGGFRGGRGGFNGPPRFQDHGPPSGGRGPRGGLGYQGGAGGYGDRSGFGGPSDVPPNAPRGPGGRSGGPGGLGGGGGGFGDRGGDRGYGGSSYGGDRSGDRGGDRGYGGDRGGFDRRGGGGHGGDRDSGPPRDRGYGQMADDRGHASRYGGRDDRDGSRDGGRDAGRDDGYGGRKRTHEDGGYGGGGDRHRRRY